MLSPLEVLSSKTTIIFHRLHHTKQWFNSTHSLNVCYSFPKVCPVPWEVSQTRLIKKFEIQLPSADKIAAILLSLTATQQCNHTNVFQPEGNDKNREHFRYTKLFCLIPNFQVRNLAKRNTWKNELNSLEANLVYRAFYRFPRNRSLRNALQRIITTNSRRVGETVPHCWKPFLIMRKRTVS